MVVEQALNASSDILGGLILEIGRVGLWLQALGVVVVVWLVFSIISFLLERKKRHIVYQLQKDVERIESKIDALLAKKH